MTNDLISRAEARIKAEYYNLPSKEMMIELVSEIKRLEEIKETGPHAISVGGKTFLSADVDENRLKQLS